MTGTMADARLRVAKSPQRCARPVRKSDIRGGAKRLERFRAKWIPVRVKKTRQNNNLELRF
jgi:hypothetical protein